MRLEDNLSDLNRVSGLLELTPVALDFVTCLCGEFISAGTFRSVFNHNLDGGYVVKVEPQNTSCNLVEYMIYEEVHHLTGDLDWVKDWFCPVTWISPNGRILVMKKTRQYENRKKPEKVPKFLWDVKSENFGWVGNKYMCHDYGQFYNMINYPRGMKKIIWD